MTINPAVSGYTEPLPLQIEPATAANNRAVSSAVRLLNASAAEGSSHQFSIAIDPVTRQAVVRVVDSVTNELVEQLPSEYILKVAQQLSERIAKQSRSAAEKAS